jgi:hypothetical protein
MSYIMKMADKDITIINYKAGRQVCSYERLWSKRIEYAIIGPNTLKSIWARLC